MYIEGQSVILRFALPRDTFLVDLLKYIVFAPLFSGHGIVWGAGEDLADCIRWQKKWSAARFESGEILFETNVSVRRKEKIWNYRN